jgi:hypothetical protein
VVWGRAVAGMPTRESRDPAPFPVSPTRILVALGVVGAATWALASAAGLGPSLVVVLVAALGSGVAVRYGRGARRAAVITLVVVAVTGIGWIEGLNKVQYGTLALTGAPPLVRWCGTTFRPSGVVTAGPSSGAGLRYSTILRTPSGYDVFGVDPGTDRSCGASGPVFVRVGQGRFAAYDPVTAEPGGLNG